MFGACVCGVVWCVDILVRCLTHAADTAVVAAIKFTRTTEFVVVLVVVVILKEYFICVKGFRYRNKLRSGLRRTK